MQVKILYFGLLRRVVSEKEEVVELPEGSSVRDLVAILVEKHGAEFQGRLFNQGGLQASDVSEISPDVFITVDGSNISTLQGLDTELTADIDMHFVLVGPVVTGGQA